MHTLSSLCVRSYTRLVSCVYLEFSVAQLHLGVKCMNMFLILCERKVVIENCLPLNMHMLLFLLIMGYVVLKQCLEISDAPCVPVFFSYE